MAALKGGAISYERGTPVLHPLSSYFGCFSKSKARIWPRVYLQRFSTYKLYSGYRDVDCVFTSYPGFDEC